MFKMQFADIHIGCVAVPLKFVQNVENIERQFIYCNYTFYDNNCTLKIKNASENKVNARSELAHLEPIISILIGDKKLGADDDTWISDDLVIQKFDDRYTLQYYNLDLNIRVDSENNTYISAISIYISQYWILINHHSVHIMENGKNQQYDLRRASSSMRTLLNFIQFDAKCNIRNNVRYYSISQQCLKYWLSTI